MAMTLVPASQTFGQAVEIGEHVVAVEQRLDDDQVWGGGILVEGDRRLHAAHLHDDMRAGEPPVPASLLDHRRRILILAKRLDIDARDRPGADRLRPARLGAGGVLGGQKRIGGGLNSLAISRFG